MSKQQITAKPVARIHYLRGAIFSLVGLIFGTLAWLWVWSIGLISAAIAYLMSVGVLWLYRRGGRTQDLDTKSAFIVTGMVSFGIIVSIFSVMLYDIIHGIFSISASAESAGTIRLLLSPTFWSYAFSNIANPEFLKFYADSVVWSVILAAIGIFPTTSSVFLNSQSEKTVRPERPIMETHRRITYVMGGFLLLLTFIPVFTMLDGSNANLYTVARLAGYLYFAPILYAFAVYAGMKLTRLGVFFAQASILIGVLLTYIAAFTTTAHTFVNQTLIVQLSNTLNVFGLIGAMYVVFRMTIPPKPNGIEADIEKKLLAQYSKRA